MGEPVLTDEEIGKIGLYVKDHISQWMEEGRIIPFSRDTMLTERIVRVEEGIKHQGDLLEKILHQMDKRFEQIDKRLEQMQINMDKRFDLMQASMDKRFSSLQWTMGLGFTILAALMGIFNFY